MSEAKESKKPTTFTRKAAIDAVEAAEKSMSIGGRLLAWIFTSDDLLIKQYLKKREGLDAPKHLQEDQQWLTAFLFEHLNNKYVQEFIKEYRKNTPWSIFEALHKVTGRPPEFAQIDQIWETYRGPQHSAAAAKLITLLGTSQDIIKPPESLLSQILNRSNAHKLPDIAELISTLHSNRYTDLAVAFQKACNSGGSPAEGNKAIKDLVDAKTNPQEKDLAEEKTILSEENVNLILDNFTHAIPMAQAIIALEKNQYCDAITRKIIGFAGNEAKSVADTCVLFREKGGTTKQLENLHDKLDADLTGIHRFATTHYYPLISTLLKQGITPAEIVKTFKAEAPGGTEVTKFKAHTFDQCAKLHKIAKIWNDPKKLRKLLAEDWQNKDINQLCLKLDKRWAYHVDTNSEGRQVLPPPPDNKNPTQRLLTPSSTSVDAQPKSNCGLGIGLTTAITVACADSALLALLHGWPDKLKDIHPKLEALTSGNGQLTTDIVASVVMAIAIIAAIYCSVQIHNNRKYNEKLEQEEVPSDEHLATTPTT